MSAPDELKLCPECISDVQSCIRPVGEVVRYLRVELICGDCGEMEQDTEDAMIWECDWFRELRDPLRPACMMFKRRAE